MFYRNRILPITIATLAASVVSFSLTTPARAQSDSTTQLNIPFFGFRNADLSKLRVDGNETAKNNGDVPFFTDNVQMLGHNAFQLHFASLYFTKDVDTSKGFSAAFDISMNGNLEGFCYVIKDKSETRDLAPQTLGLDANKTAVFGFSNLRYAVTVSFLEKSFDNSGLPTILVKGPAQGNSDRLIAKFTVPSIIFQGSDPKFYTGKVQIRYLPDYQTLDIFMSGQLIGRVLDFSFDPSFFTSGGQTRMGLICATRGAGLGSAEDVGYSLRSWNIGDHLVFDPGIGGNYYNEKFPFQTKKQSVYGPGTNLNWRREFATDWNSSFHNSSFKGSGDFRFGGGLDVDTAGHLGIIFKANANGGLADIDYPVNLNMSFPDQRSIPRGSSFSVIPFYNADVTAQLKTTTPTANFIAEFDKGGNLDLDAQAVLFGRNLIGNDGKLIHFNIPRKNTEFFNLDTIRNSRALPILQTALGFSGFLQDDEGSSGAMKSNRRGTPGKGGKGAAKSGFNPMDYIEFGVHFPNLDVNAPVGTDFTNSRVIKGSAISPVLTLDANFTSALLGLVEGIGEVIDKVRKEDISVDLGAGDSVKVGWTSVDVFGRVEEDLEVRYEFTPKVRVELKLQEMGGSSLPSVFFDLDVTTGKIVGQPPQLRMPANGLPLVITPCLTLNNSFKPFIGPVTKGTIGIDPFQVYADIESAGNAIFKTDTDPLFGFPLTAYVRTPPNSDPAIPAFTIGTEENQAQGIQPFRTLIGKPYILLPALSLNPIIAYSKGSQMSSLIKPAGDPGVTLVTFDLDGADAQSVVRFGENLNNPNNTLATQVNLRTTPATATVSIPNRLLTAQGTLRLTLINGASSVREIPSNSLTFAINAPAPVINSVSPATIVIGSVPSVPIKTVGTRNFFELTINGGGFIAPSGNLAGTSAMVAGNTVPTRFVSANQLVAEVPAEALANSGIAEVCLMTPTPGGGKSEIREVRLLNPVPSLNTDGTGLSQTSSPPGSPAFNMTVRGSGFVRASQIRLNGVSRPASFLSENTLAFPLSEDDLKFAGTNEISVFNPGIGGSIPSVQNGGGVSNSLTFQVAAPSGRAVLKVNTTLRRDPETREVIVTFNLVNNSSLDAEKLTLSYLSIANGVGTSTAITPINSVFPIFLGTLEKSKSVAVPVSFRLPASLISGTQRLLTLTGSYSNGGFSSKLKVTIP